MIKFKYSRIPIASLSLFPCLRRSSTIGKEGPFSRWKNFCPAIVKPMAIVALGATAARSLFGRTVTIAKARGRVLHLADDTAAFVTIHPSWLLRIHDDADKEREYRNFVADLRQAASVLAKQAA